ncbi:unnamed protein product [Mycena citricolor]|uniref:NmrA-like domain-containing protein n=1 Tax=Mycena citricolor TaxID=2018698 RepID=A0AAD2HMB1_9AGAR|nr:unnamed protein product [Mycena citricolor]
MTISTNPSAPLVAVVGGTGNQGRSVIDALDLSPRPYRIRGFTRDVTKPAAQKLAARGVVMYAVDLTVQNKDAVMQAFVGADLAFLVTNFWEHVDPEREIAEGKLMIDAVKAAAVKRVVWSGLPSPAKFSDGKYTEIVHFETKAEISIYGRESGVPIVDVQAGYYSSNLFNPIFGPQKQEDGSFALEWPFSRATQLPMIDTATDYGLWVLKVFEQPEFPVGSTLHTAAEMISFEDITFQLAKATGKKIFARQLPVPQFVARCTAAAMPPHIVRDMQDTAGAVGEFGYYPPGAPIANSEGLLRAPRKWAEIARTTDWSSVLA